MDIVLQPRERKTIRMTASTAGFVEVGRGQAGQGPIEPETIERRPVRHVSRVHVTRLVSPFHEAVGLIPVETLDPIWLRAGDEVEMDLAHDGDTPQELHLSHRPGADPYLQSGIS
jgi:hypothetical protein